mgnify:CR=1 FL=1
MKKTLIISGYSEFEERETHKQMHGIIVIKGGKNLKVIEIEEE